MIESLTSKKKQSEEERDLGIRVLERTSKKGKNGGKVPSLLSFLYKRRPFMFLLIWDFFLLTLSSLIFNYFWTIN